MDYGRDGSGDVTAIKSDGTEVAPVDGSCTLANSTTYYFPVGKSKAPLPSQTALVSAHFKWAAAVVAVITVETCNFPNRKHNLQGMGPDDVTDYDSTAGNWTQWNAPAAYVPVTGSGNSASAATVTTGGSAAGSAVYEMEMSASRRIRFKVVVTTGGAVRCNVHGKAGA